MGRKPPNPREGTETNIQDSDADNQKQVGNHPCLERGRKLAPCHECQEISFCRKPPNPREGTETLEILESLLLEIL